VIQELCTAFGANNLTAIQLFVENNGSPVNGKGLIRSFNNVANQPPQLLIRYTI
jgi:hypothetical protein